MALPDIEIILLDIERGYEDYSDLAHSNILREQLGNCGCCEDNYMCLLYILKSLEWRLEEELLDDKITEILYNQLITIIGSTDFNSTKYYFGTSEDGSTPTLEEIEVSDYLESLSDINPIIDFPLEETPTYFWMAELSTQPLKTKWQDTVLSFNNGNIGTIDDLFGVPVTVSTYRVYITRYPTQFSNPIQFKIS